MFLSSPYLEPFCHAGLFLGLGYGLEYFLGLLMYTINFDFVSKALYFLFSYHLHLGPFALFGPYWSMFGLGSGSKTFFRPTHIDYQLCFWKLSAIFSLLLQPHLGPFLPFWGPTGQFMKFGSDSKKILGLLT